MFTRCPAFREAAHPAAGGAYPCQWRMHRRLRAPVEAVFEIKGIPRLDGFLRLPEADDVIQRLPGGRDLHQVDRPFAPAVARLDPQAWALVVPAHNVLIVIEVAIELQQAEALRVVILEGVELQFLRVIQRTADPLAVTAPHGEAIRVVDLRVNGVAHPALVVAAAEHAGHRRDADLLDVLASIEVVFHLHNHLRLLAVNGELVRPGDARAVEQRIDHKGGVVGFRGFKPERGEVRELFRGIGEGIHRQTTGGESVLVGVIHRAEVAGPEERDDVAARQLRRFEGAESGEAQVALPLKLTGIDPGIVVVKQLRAEVDLPGLTGGGVQREHAHPAAEAHADVEELHVQLAPLDVAPQRVGRIVLNAVVLLGREGSQRLRQRAWRPAPRLAGEIPGHRLKDREIKGTALTIRDTCFLRPGFA